MKKQVQEFLKRNPMRLLLLAMMLFIGQGVLFSQGLINVTNDADSGEGSLRQAIVDAVDGDVITFGGAITTITLDSTLNLGDKTVTIEGRGAVVLTREKMAIDSFRIVTITGDSGKVITMKNLTIENGIAKGAKGGGLWAVHDKLGQTILEGVIFQNNLADGEAGGAYIEGYHADTASILTNCEFIGNSAVSGNAGDGDGGGILAENTIISGCTFTENYCDDDGGAARPNAGVLFENCTFTGNTAGSTAGAIRIGHRSVIISNSKFVNNSAGDGSGAVFMARGTISNCEFVGNIAAGANGGAVYANQNPAIIENSIFRGNSALDHGGAIYLDDPGQGVINCIFENNAAGSNGGGVYINNSSYVVGSVFAHNSADSIGGGLYVGKGNVINSTFTKNYAAENGGGLSGDGEWLLANSIVYDNDAAGADKDIQVVSNSAAGSASNSAVGVEPAGWTAVGITVLTESPFVGGSEADSLMLPSGSALIDGGDITGIAADIPETDLNGVKRVINGAIDLGPYERYISLVVTTNADDGAGSLRQAIADAVDGESLVTFADDITTIKVDQALELGDKGLIIDGGGDVVLDGAFNGDPTLDIHRVMTITGVAHKDVTIHNLTIQNGNAATGNGGGLSADHSAGGKTMLENVTFKDNVANVEGGGAYIIGYNADTVSMVTGCEFIGNSTGNDGGGTFAENAMFSECSFTENDADAGGAARAENGVLFDNCTFTGNTAVTAGAIRLSDKTATASNSTFEDNATTGNAGAVFMARGSVLNCEFINNTSAGDGGAIFANQNGPDPVIDNSMFSGNSAQGVGGAIYVDDGGILTNCVVKNNTAANGGGLYLAGKNALPSVVGFVIANNTATAKGGGVYVLSGNVINSIITKNSAGENGGALTGNGAWFMANTIVWDNDAVGVDKNIEVVANSATTAAANSAIDATAYNAAAWTATDIITLDASPFVGGSEADSLHSLGSSGLVDAGTLDYGVAALLPEFDLDGEYRVQGVVDIGAYEKEAIRVTGVSVDKAILEVTVGGTGTLVASVEPSFADNTSVTWSSSDESVATVVDGVVTGVAAGSVTITVTTVDGGFTATSAVSVATAVTGVTLDQTAVTMEVAETVTLVATVAPADATDQTVFWSSDDEDVATVDGGVVTAVAPGTATISAVTLDGSFIATCDVTVNEAAIAVTGVSLDQATLALEPAGTATLVATVTPDDATDKTVTWSSSDEAVATVADGVVTAVADGTCTITVTTTDGGFTATCAVTVETVGIELFEAGIRLYPNPVQNYLIIEGENIKSIAIYSVTGTAVMTVNQGFSKGINVSAIQTGMYFLKISTDKGTAVTTIIKE